MKYLYLLLFIPVMAFSQNFSFETHESYCAGEASEIVIESPIFIYNNTDQTLSMRWIRTDYDYPEGWSHSHCDPLGCNPEGVGKRDFLLLPDNELNEYINVHFHPNNIAGNGWVQVSVFEIDDQENAVTLTFNAEVDETTGLFSINQQYAAYLSQNYPNPSNGNTAINYEIDGKLNDVTFTLTDVTGRIVYQQPINNTKGNIQLNNLPTGIYQYNLSTTQMVLASKQMMVK